MLSRRFRHLFTVLIPLGVFHAACTVPDNTFDDAEYKRRKTQGAGGGGDEGGSGGEAGAGGDAGTGGSTGGSSGTGGAGAGGTGGKGGGGSGGAGAGGAGAGGAGAGGAGAGGAGNGGSTGGTGGAGASGAGNGGAGASGAGAGGAGAGGAGAAGAGAGGAGAGGAGAGGAGAGGAGAGGAGTGGGGTGGAPNGPCKGASDCQSSQVCSKLVAASESSACQDPNASASGVIADACANNGACKSKLCDALGKVCTAFCTTGAECGNGVCVRAYVSPFTSNTWKADMCEKSCKRNSDCPVNAGGVTKTCRPAEDYVNDQVVFTCSWVGGNPGDPNIKTFGETMTAADFCDAVGLTIGGTEYCSRACVDASDCAAPLPLCQPVPSTNPSGAGASLLNMCVKLPRTTAG